MNRMQIAMLSIAGASVLASGGFLLGRHTQAPGEQAAPAVLAASSAGERKVLYWHDPMVPSARFDKPGKSPFMDMQLAPVYADEASNAGVQVSSATQQNLGIRLAAVRRTAVPTSFDAIGTVQFDERLNVDVQVRVAGYVEKLAVRAPMERVRKGQPLATLYAPDWLAPQNELLALKRAGVSQDLITAARERMRAMSIPDALIHQSEETGTAQARFPVLAPAGGVVTELGVREGVAVSPGMTLFRIAGLEKVWAVVEIPEAQAMHLVRGQRVQAALQADATQTFDGELTELLAQVNASTRTLQARFEVSNKGGKLIPGMLLRLHIVGPSSSRMMVPSEAVIRTGTRAVAIVRNAHGLFEPHELELGLDQGDTIEVLRGLSEGDQVVASGQFLIDSEARLKSVLGAMTPANSASASASAVTAHEKAGHP